MARCERCGRALASDREDTGETGQLTVTEELIACLNYAFSTAQAKGAAEVRLIHVLHAIAVRKAFAGPFATERSEWAALREQFAKLMTAEAAIGRRAIGAPKTSAELRAVLDAASRYAHSLGNEAADVGDVLRAAMTIGADRTEIYLLAASPFAHDLAPLAPSHFAALADPPLTEPLPAAVPRLRPLDDSGAHSRQASRQMERQYHQAPAARTSHVAEMEGRSVVAGGPSMERFLLQLVQRVEALETTSGSNLGQLTHRDGHQAARTVAHHDRNRQHDSLERKVDALREQVALTLSLLSKSRVSSDAQPSVATRTDREGSRSRKHSLRGARLRSAGSRTHRSWTRSSRTRRWTRRFARRRWGDWRRYLLGRGWEAVRRARGTSERTGQARPVSSQSPRLRRSRWPRRPSATKSTRTAHPPSRPDADHDHDADDFDEPTAEKRFYLSLDDDVVNAPSIGPRTAERIHPAGISTVLDLLASDPDEAAAALKVRYITAPVIRDWQDQARLVCTVPWLRGTHAQLLVGAGYRSAEAIAAADPDDLTSAILSFAATKDGQRVLRNGSPPDLEKIVRWVRHAGLAELDRAA